MALCREGITPNTISIYFVQYGASCSKEMRSAFSVCQEAKFAPKIISEETVKDIELGRNIVFVLENFNGDIFEYLSLSDCLVVGPCCLSSCIIEEVDIPNNGSPVFNTALRGVVICSTKLNKKDKDEVKQLSGFMGAIYSDDLTLAVTHLIAEKAVLQPGKFMKACDNNILIISPDWIRKSWEASKMGSKVPDPKTFKVSTFRGMYISCSNLSMSVKKKLQTVIEANGGVYQRTLELNKTAVLVIGNPEGKKWQHAQQWGIPCVSPSWVYESAEKGCLVQSINHLVLARPKCSTPTKSEENNSFMTCSDISVVPTSSDGSKIDETNMSMSSTRDISLLSVRSEHKNKKNLQDGEYKKLLEEITLTDIKAAGLFLDGCKIYLSGFTVSECEKLKKIINSGGATLYTSISDSISHIVVGDLSFIDTKELSSLVPRPHVVKLEWLIQCMKEKRTIGVEPYLCLQAAPAPPASPLSHKGLKLLKSQSGVESPTTPNENRTQVSRKLFVKATVLRPSLGLTEMESNSIDVSALEKRALEEMNKDKEEKLKKQKEMELQKAEEARKLEEMQKKATELRLEQSKMSKQASTLQNISSNDGDQSTMEPFFQDLWFQIYGFDEITQIQESVELVGGRLVTSPSDPVPDYAIVPVEGSDLKIKAKNIVSIIFVEDCYDHACLITDLEYYHKPVHGLSNVEKLLEGTVFGLSGFSRAERRLLVYVATKLGALVQDMFSRTDHPDKGVKKSTHLICKEMSGKKYEAALKWGIPVVPSTWLLSLVEKAEENSQHSNKSLNFSTEGKTVTEEIEAAPHDETFVPMQMDEADKLNITPANQILRRVSVPGSAGPSPFHIQTPNTPYGKVLTDCTPSPDTRKRWKKWIDDFPDHYEGSPSATMKPKRPSTPLDVIKKQLWVKYGGVSFDGIESGTGKLTSNGPYAEWASNNASFESFAVEAEEIKTSLRGENAGESSEGIISAIHRRLSGIRDLEATGDPALAEAKSGGENLSAERLSSRFELSQNESPRRQFDDKHDEEKQVIQWDFEPAKFLSSSSSNIDRTQKSQESLSNVFEDITKKVSDISKVSAIQEGKPKENIPSNNLEASKRTYKSSKLLASKSHEKSAKTSPEPVPRKIPRLDPTVANVNENTPVFLLSGLPANVKSKYEGIIRQLSGGVTQTPSYDPATTHIIVEKPIRSEKLLCCIAAGKWVLHTSYVERCYEARCFLPEEEFEWGNQMSSGRLPRLNPGSTEEGLANASYRWRQRRNDMGSASPFRDMRVVLFTSENKFPQFKRLLAAGNATILDQSEIFRANYVIWEEGKVEMTVPLAEIAQRKIHVVPPVFLGEFLVKNPSPSDYYPESYSKCFKSKKAFVKR